MVSTNFPEFHWDIFGTYANTKSSRAKLLEVTDLFLTKEGEPQPPTNIYLRQGEFFLARNVPIHVVAVLGRSPLDELSAYYTEGLSRILNAEIQLIESEEGGRRPMPIDMIFTPRDPNKEPLPLEPRLENYYPRQRNA